MRTREKVAWLLVLTSLTVVYDVVFVMNGWANSFPTGQIYIISGWFLVWGLCYGITRSFWYAIAACVTMAAVEDFFFILIRNLFQGIPVWDMYCHEWVASVLPPFSKYFGFNWGGFPSGYIMQPLVGLIIAAPRFFGWYHVIGRSIVKTLKGS